jgi:hypothetical protein
MPEWPATAFTIDTMDDYTASVHVWGLLFTFAGVGADSYLNDGEVRPREELPETLTVYRGVTGDVGATGMSWSTEFKQAHWFASRWGTNRGTPRVYRADLPREAVLAMFHEGRSENEVVVDPGYLTAHPDAVQEVEPGEWELLGAFEWQRKA